MIAFNPKTGSFELRRSDSISETKAAPACWTPARIKWPSGFEFPFASKAIRKSPPPGTTLAPIAPVSNDKVAGAWKPQRSRKR